MEFLLSEEPWDIDTCSRLRFQRPSRMANRLESLAVPNGVVRRTLIFQR